MMQQQPTIIVIGNEKGGTGKSTVTMHLITYLIHLGFKVGSLDLDARQGTLTRYVENRASYNDYKKLTLAMPEHYPVQKSPDLNIEIAQNEDHENFTQRLQGLYDNDFIVIDTPGSDQYLSRLAHSYADILITPLNDSFVDLDMLAQINTTTGQIIRPSTYCEMVWDQKKQRAMRKLSSFDWIVLRNRLSTLFAKNKQEMQITLEKLGKRVGFRPISGFSERVIYRELFLKGLTVLDLEQGEVEMSLSHVAAKQELRELMTALNLEKVQAKLNSA